MGDPLLGDGGGGWRHTQNLSVSKKAPKGGRKKSQYFQSERFRVIPRMEPTVCIREETET